MIQVTSMADGHFSVSDRDGNLIATFTRHRHDTSIGLRIVRDGADAYVQQRHLPEEPEARERINRIFDDTPLPAEIGRLKELHDANRRLWDEKSVTTDTSRYRDLTDGGLLRDSDMSLEVQRDIVSAKIILTLGISAGELCRLGLL